MGDYRIAVLEGDGIGPEVMECALKTLLAIGKKFSHTFNFLPELIGGSAIDGAGCPLPKQTLDTCLNADAVMLGAVGGPKWDKLNGKSRPEYGLLSLRESMGLFANLRPILLYPSLISASPLKNEILMGGIDIMIVRELTGGIYFGKRQRAVHNDGYEYAYDTEEYSVPEIERIAKVAFETAMKRSRRVCSVDKANVLESSRLWRETISMMQKSGFKDAALSHMYVDNAAMQLIRDPRQFDVIVTSNMFGDILSDEASMITGALGMLPSASLGFGSRGLYEPVHGSAPDLSGRDAANPLGCILSAALMLRYSFDLEEEACCIEKAVNAVLDAGVRTCDIAEPGSEATGTSAMRDMIIEKILA